jgi:hypothetical protein
MGSHRADPAERLQEKDERLKDMDDVIACENEQLQEKIEVIQLTLLRPPALQTCAYIYSPA